MPVALDRRRASLAADLDGIVDEAEQMMARDDFDPDDQSYTVLRERRETTESQLADVLATIEARRMAQHTPVTEQGEQLSPMRQVLREYDSGNSPRFLVDYDLDAVIMRELQTGDPYFTPSASRIQVASLPLITPSLDLVRKVQTGQAYDFVVPPPVVQASTVPEGAQKPTRTWSTTPVIGTLETDAHLIDVTRQTLEDDATAERTLRAWLVDGVRLKQDAKCAAAIAGATGTQTTTGADVASATRAGKAELSALGITATAVYLHPDDASALDLATLSAVNPAPNGLSTIWGMRIVESPAITVGTPIVGAIGQAVYLLYRNSISTYLTDSGMTQETTPRDRFSHNLLGILAEGRSRAHVVAPYLLVKCTVTP